MYIETMEHTLSDLLNVVYGIYNRYHHFLNLAGIISVLYMIFYGHIQSYIINSLVFIYLCYKSMVALTTPSQFELAYILKCWICFGCYCGFEHIADCIVGYLPLSFVYYLGKLVFYCYVINNPSCVETMYCKYVLPYYECYNCYLEPACKYIETSSGECRTRVGKYYKTCKTDSLKYCKRKIVEILMESDKDDKEGDKEE